MDWWTDLKLWTNLWIAQKVWTKDERQQRVRNAMQSVELSRGCRIIRVDFSCTEQQKRLIYAAGLQ